MYQNLLGLLLLLSVAVGAVSVARHFKMPAMLAYLVVGMALGPHGFGALSSTEEAESLAEFGIVFLMFSIGLEFSLPKLITMRRLVFGFGGGQMLVTAAGTMLFTLFFYQQPWRVGLAVGLAVAMSSTAIVAKMLSERFELHSRSGHQTMGVLLFQDLAVVPCLILFPALANPEESLGEALAIASVQAVMVLGILIFVGQRIMSRLLDAVAHRKSEELFVLAILWIVIGLSYATGAAGLSLALGAFVGGMLISETAYRHQVEADIRPFRDILLGIFFVTVGMMLDLGFVWEHIDRLALAVVLLVSGKGLAVMVVSKLAKSPLDVSLRTSAQLAQAGEFGLVLIQFANALKLVQGDVYQVTMAAMLISMFIAPLLINRATRFSGGMAKGDWAHKATAIHDIAVKSMGLERHVIVCGFGRTGETIARFLAAEHLPLLVLDTDPQRVKDAEAEGHAAVFGNADRLEVLTAAGLVRARAVVVAYPDYHDSERVIRLVREHRIDIPIIARAVDNTGAAYLKRAGATEVVPEVVESGLMLAAETLTQIGVPMERAMNRVRQERAARYSSLKKFYGRKTPQGNEKP